MIYLLVCFLVGVAIVTLSEWGRKRTPERFLVAERKLGGLFGSLAVAASWIWAPAIFVSTQVGYKWGYAGLFWFVLPNILALTLFAPVAYKVRHKLPEGFSYIQFIEKRGGYFRQIQLFVQLFVQVLCCAIQVTAGAELLTYISGTPYVTIVAMMSLASLSYCLIAGLVSSLLIDCIKYLVVVGTIALIYFNLPVLPNIASVTQGPINPLDPTVLWQFGLGSALTLIFGIFSNHQQWQRAFASNYWEVRQTYRKAAYLHGLVTFSLGTLGVLLAKSGYVTQHIQIVGAEYINTQMAPIFSAAFTVMAIGGLCATMSSALCAFGSLYSTELVKGNDPVKASRQAMVVLAILSFLIGAIRFPLVSLWMFAGLIRLGTAVPTILSIYSPKLSGKVGTSAIIVSIALGAPLFIYGATTGNYVCQTSGMLVCLAITTMICLIEILTPSPGQPVAGDLAKVAKEVPELSLK
jgi:Na+/proline symporter